MRRPIRYVGDRSPPARSGAARDHPTFYRTGRSHFLIHKTALASKSAAQRSFLRKESKLARFAEIFRLTVKRWDKSATTHFKTSPSLHRDHSLKQECSRCDELWAMASSPSFASEKKRWWLGSRRVVEKYIKDAKLLIATQAQSEIASAVGLLDAALALSPGLEIALELKARALLRLRRIRDIAEMLQDYIPSCKLRSEENSAASNSSSSQLLSRDRIKLLSASNSSSPKPPDRDGDFAFKCFSVSDLKKKVLSGLHRHCEKEEQWRYIVSGQACYHLGLMEDAMILLQTGKRLASAAIRRKSISLSEDSFYFSEGVSICPDNSSLNHSVPPSSTSAEFDSISQLLAHIKLLLRRRAAAIAALNSGAYAEAIRHFSKILESRRRTPQGFVAECYTGRAGAYQCTGRIAEAIADCNRTLALDPASIPALILRAALLESIRSLPDCLRDLGHLKLLYDTMARDRKLSGPAWKQSCIRHSEVVRNLRSVNDKIQELRRRMGSGDVCNVDYYALIGIPRGCKRSVLERAHLLLCLRHRPDRAIGFVERCEFLDDRDADAVKEQARMSALLLFRLLQKGYSSVMAVIMDEEAAERRRQRVAASSSVTPKRKSSPAEEGGEPIKTLAIHAPAMETKRALFQDHRVDGRSRRIGPECETSSVELPERATAMTPMTSVVQGVVFCREMASIGNLCGELGFNRQIPMKFEALSC